MKLFLPRVIFLLLAFSPFMLSAQEDHKYPEGVSPPDYEYRKAEPKEVDRVRVEPPFWWVGMTHPTVEVLIYDQNISGYTPEINHPGVQVAEVTRLPNPNYLFVTLQIGPGAKVGKFPIILSNGPEQRAYDYELKARDKSLNRVQGVDASDFIYLLMPDRFANGDTTNDSVEGMEQSGVDRDNVFFRHGGDLVGVMEHMNYFEDLGATALWLNPVLENDEPYESYHGYAITDHYNIDARLGTNEQYKYLVDLAHERGIKVVMDVIFNHVGHLHWFIEDLPAEDWIHQFDEYTGTVYRAPTRMDPYVAQGDLKYVNEGWFDHHMPDLNQQHPQLSNYLIQNCIWWTEYSGQDGFRIDTYVYVDQEFMAEWARRLKAEFPNVSFFAETWVHGTSIQAFFTEKNYLKDTYDSDMPGVTDYQVYYSILEALSRQQGWTDGISRLYYTLAKDFLYNDPYRNVIFLDNHDLGRIYEALGQHDIKFKTALSMLMTLRGIPMLYYGTELKMTGSGGGAFSEGGRKDFPGGWKTDTLSAFTSSGRTGLQEQGFQLIKSLANYRKETPALQDGKLMQFIPRDGIYVYFRYDSDKTIMVVVNTNGDAVSIDTKRYEERMLGFNKGMNILTQEIHSDLSKIDLEGYDSVILELRR